MAIESIFTVTNDQLGALTPEQAVTTLREILWAEATTLGIAKSLIDVPNAINVADNGVDAEVRNVPVNALAQGNGIIKEGLTCYQVKTGRFAAGQKQHVEELLFTPESIKQKTYVLQDRVKGCLDTGGTFVVVLFGWDGPKKLSQKT